MAKRLSIKFSCVNDDLQTLSEMEYLSEHSQFRLETSFFSDYRDIAPLLRYNGRFLATEIQISSSELERILSNVTQYISLRGSTRINRLRIPVSDLISHETGHGLAVRNQSEETVELYLENGPLCPESMIESIEANILMPGGEISHGIFALVAVAYSLEYRLIPPVKTQNVPLVNPTMSRAMQFSYCQRTGGQ